MDEEPKSIWIPWQYYTSLNSNNKDVFYVFILLLASSEFLVFKDWIKENNIYVVLNTAWYEEIELISYYSSSIIPL